MDDNTFAYFSNFGLPVKVAAPGVGILSTLNGTAKMTLKLEVNYWVL
jgi:subtilisin family serine protease